MNRVTNPRCAVPASALATASGQVVSDASAHGLERADPASAAGTGTTLDLEDVAVSYGARTVVSGVRLTVPPGRITALIGPSGSGKTSLLHAINRLSDLIPGCRVSGRVLLNGADVLASGQNVRHLRRRVGMIFQKPVPFPVSIRTNLELPLRDDRRLSRPEQTAVIEDALRAVGLWSEVRDRLDAPALHLSGGQQQRLCLARALTLDPDVLLLDEPCSALDPRATQVIEQLLLRLRSRCTIVIVTHNLAQARRVSDHAAVLWPVDGTGRLIESGPSAELFAHPGREETREYLSGAIG